MGNWRTVGAVSGWRTAASLRCYTVFAATGATREAFGLSEALIGVVVTVGSAGASPAASPRLP
jgi:hypothetical protein